MCVTFLKLCKSRHFFKCFCVALKKNYVVLKVTCIIYIFLSLIFAYKSLHFSKKNLLFSHKNCDKNHFQDDKNLGIKTNFCPLVMDVYFYCRKIFFIQFSTTVENHLMEKFHYEPVSQKQFRFLSKIELSF